MAEGNPAPSTLDPHGLISWVFEGLGPKLSLRTMAELNESFAPIERLVCAGQQR
jgi:hypothetical protein